MKPVLAAMAFSLLPSVTFATCPDYLDQELRKLHSQDTVNLCEVQAGGPMLVINTASHCKAATSKGRCQQEKFGKKFC